MRTVTASRSASKIASVDVAQILAVSLERHRLATDDLDPVDVVAAEERRGGRAAAVMSAARTR